MLLEISGEITPEGMKGWRQSQSNTQLWMGLVIEARFDAVALIASFILGFIINTVIILVFMGEFTFYWYVYIVLAILFFVMSTCVLELTLQRQYQHSIIENLIRDE